MPAENIEFVERAVNSSHAAILPSRHDILPLPTNAREHHTAIQVSKPSSAAHGVAIGRLLKMDSREVPREKAPPHLLNNHSSR
ncbi:MAG: hypothetical protein M1396_05305 [Chloroflexi bacterium]|nr:hypothetical protein [Chloroflexota bacterium]